MSKRISTTLHFKEKTGRPIQYEVLKIEFVKFVFEDITLATTLQFCTLFHF